MRHPRNISPARAGAALLALAGLSGCAPSAPPAATAIAAPPTATVVAVRHAAPGQSGAALGRIMTILGQPMPGGAGPGTEIVIRLPDGSVKSVAEPGDPAFAPGQAVSVTQAQGGVIIHPL